MHVRYHAIQTDGEYIGYIARQFLVWNTRSKNALSLIGENERNFDTYDIDKGKLVITKLKQ